MIDSSLRSFLLSRKGGLAVAIYTLGVVAMLATYELAFGSIEFDAARWRDDPAARRRMANSLVQGDQLIGLTEASVIRMLGEPDNSLEQRARDHSLLYLVGTSCVWLEVAIKDGIAASTSLESD